MDPGGTSASSTLISAFSCSPRSGLPRCAPSVSPRVGAVGGRTRPGGRRGCATRARRLRARPEAVLLVPGLPESARPAVALSPRKRLTARARPVSPATLVCGMAHPPGGGHRRPLRPGHSRQRVGTPSLAADESLRSTSPPFSRKSNSGNVVPYLPATLPPLTFCTLEVGAEVIMQTSGAVLRRYPAPFLFILKAALSHLHNNGLSRMTQQMEAKLIFFASASL